MNSIPNFYDLAKSNKNQMMDESEDLELVDEKKKETITEDFYSAVKNKNKVSDFHSAVKQSESKKNDFYSAVKKAERPESIESFYKVEEKTPEQLKVMSPEEKYQYAQDIKTQREYLQSRGLIRGTASGLTAGASEYIPGLKLEENDLMVGTGKLIGSAYPIGKLYSVVGAPLVKFAAKTPIGKQAFKFLARTTGFGLAGATYESAEEAIKGEIPSPTEFLKNAATYASIDTLLQSLGIGVAFSKAVKDISRKEGIPALDVMNKLWKSTKNYLKGKKIEKPTVESVETLNDIAQKAAKEGLETVELEVPKTRMPEAEIRMPKAEIRMPEAEIRMPEAEIRMPKAEIRNANDLSFEEAQYELNKLKEFERSIIEPKVGKEIYEGQYEKHGFEGKQRFWNKYEDRFTEKELDEFEDYENYPYLEEDLRKRISKIREINTSYNIAQTPEESIRNVLKDITHELILHEIPENKSTINYTFNLLSKKGHTKEQISKELISLLKRDLSESDAEYIINDLFSNSKNKTNNTGNVFGQPQVFIPKNVEQKTKAPKIPISDKKKDEPTKITEETPKSKKSTEPLKPIRGTKQAKKRSDIIELFRKAFNDPIRLGKIPKRYAGLHAEWPKVTRLLKDNDVETAAHEIGHNLHYTLYGADAKNEKDMARNVTKALAPFKEELVPLGKYAPLDLEGFAEFTRMYVTNPEAAQELAPKFYDQFEEDLTNQYPEMLKALLKAREYYSDYLEGTPQSRIDAQISFGSDISKLDNAVENIKKNGNFDNLKTQFLDQFYPAKRAVADAFGVPTSQVDNIKDEKNLYRSLRVLKGAVGKGDVFVMHETFDPITLKKTGEGLRDILKDLPDKKSEREFNRYLVARRVTEKATQNIETGITLEDAIDTVNIYKKKYEPLATRLDKYNDQVLQYAEKSGLISLKQYENIKKSNVLYTPFQRVIKGKEAQGVSAKVQARKPIKRMKGSTRDIIAPLESIIKNTYAIVINSEKNLTGQTLGKLATMKDVGQYVERVRTPITVTNKLSKEEIIAQMSRDVSPELAEHLYDIMPDFFVRFGATTYPAGENIVTVFYEGKPKYFEVSPELYEMWSKGTAPYTTNLITKVLRAPAKLLRAGAILNPKFIQKNFIRDLWGSWLFTQYGKSIKDPASLLIDTIYQPLAMLAESAKKGTLYVEWLKSGGGMSTMQSIDRKAVAKQLDEIRNGLKPTDILGWLRKVGEISEEANRLNEFAKALEVEGDSRLGREISALASRDLSVDFAKMGLQVKALNQIIPFFNATIQGGDKLLRTLGNPNTRNEFLARAVGFVAIPALILAWLNKDDEEIQELQNQERDFNFITRIGDTLLKIPVPFETGVVMNGLTQRMYRYFMEKDPRAFEGFMGSILDASMPNFIPSFANPFIETYANKNFFTGGRVVPLPLEKLTSKFQYKTYTSETAKLIGRAVNYIAGEDTQSKFASPIIIDHFIRSWSAGLGQLVVKLVDTSLTSAGIGDKIPKPYEHITEKLGLNAFIVKYPRANTQSIEDFYNNYQDAQSRFKSIQYAEKNRLLSPEEALESKKRYFDLYKKDVLDGAYKSMQAAQHAINGIMKHPDITSEEKREMIDKIYLQMIGFAKRANDIIRSHKTNRKQTK